ncbi:MAG: ribonuclease H [Sulfurimonas sp.]|nr:MAG: ribonuclease H [Sulfurimonas sp.]
MQKITETFLQLGIDKTSDISENQLILLDIDFDKKKLWFDLAIGKNISDARAELFVLLKGISAKTNQDKIIKNYKNLQKFRKDEKDIPKVEEFVQETEKQVRESDVTIYCDGGCSPNPGKSGSGIAVYRDSVVSELWYGLYESNGTNNTAELNALYTSLLIAQKELDLGNKVKIKCDSMYSINCIQTWAINWEKKGWTKKGGEIKNLDIIKKSYTLYNQVKNKISLSHIKAHAGLEGNELADRMTIYARKTKSIDFIKYEGAIDIAAILDIS